MTETQCVNKCGNLTVEGSEYCQDCKDEEMADNKREAWND